MSTAARRRQVRESVSAYRARMRRAGFKLVQFWIPDRSSKAFKAEARRQMKALATSSHAAEDQAFVDAITDDR